MAVFEAVLSELLDAFRAGEGVDLVRDAVRLVDRLIELVENPLDDLIVGVDEVFAHSIRNENVTAKGWQVPRLLTTTRAGHQRVPTANRPDDERRLQMCARRTVRVDVVRCSRSARQDWIRHVQPPEAGASGSFPMSEAAQLRWWPARLGPDRN